MTRPKRWPKNAEAARLEALAAAMQIDELGQQAKAAIWAGKQETSMLLVAEMQLLAKDIRLALVMCKGDL